jgi:hypothetical protein
MPATVHVITLSCATLSCATLSCAIRHAEGRLRTNDSAESKGQNSREIFPPETTLRSDFKSTTDQETAFPL